MGLLCIFADFPVKSNTIQNLPTIRADSGAGSRDGQKQGGEARCLLLSPGLEATFACCLSCSMSLGEPEDGLNKSQAVPVCMGDSLLLLALRYPDRVCSQKCELLRCSRASEWQAPHVAILLHLHFKPHPHSALFILMATEEQ